MHGLFVGNVQTGGQQGLFILQLVGKSTDVFFEVSDLFALVTEVFSQAMVVVSVGSLLTVGS